MGGSKMKASKYNIDVDNSDIKSEQNIPLNTASVSDLTMMFQSASNFWCACIIFLPYRTKYTFLLRSERASRMWFICEIRVSFPSTPSFSPAIEFLNRSIDRNEYFSLRIFSICISFGCWVFDWFWIVSKNWAALVDEFFF